MLGKRYDGEVCSAARTLEVVGERWSLLIIRDAMFAGSTRFTEFQRKLGIAPNVLTARLNDFVAADIFSATASGAGSIRDYHLTRKGWDLAPVLVALTAWGDEWAPDPRGIPITYRHQTCGGHVAADLRCSECGAEPPSEQVVADVSDWARQARAAHRK